MYYYESHMGGIYTTEEELDYDSLYCDECGDSDWYIGNFNTFEDFLTYYADEINYYGCGGYDLQYLINDLSPTFDYDKALQIVKENKKGVMIDKYKFIDEMMETLCPEHCVDCPFDRPPYECAIQTLTDKLLENYK